MKKIGMKLLFLGFLIGSMYLTNQGILTMHQKDPIMKEIEKSKEKYEVLPTNAIIEEQGIIPGIYGVKIDLEESFHKMKQYGSYNESLTVLKEEPPSISIEEHYEYYISKGNNKNREVALIFPLQEKSIKLLEILRKENISATIFLDGKIVEESTNLISNYNEHEYEISTYNDKYNESLLKAASSYLETITKQKTKYCYLEEKNEKILKFCAKQKKHTIKPVNIWKDSLYHHIKKDLESGKIYSIEWNEETEKELSSMIEYIKSHGYQFVTLKTLLREKE